MVGHKRRLSLREVPAMACHRHRRLPRSVVHSGILGLMLQGFIAAVGVSVLRVFDNNTHLLHHGLRFRGYQQRGRGGRVESGIQRIPTGGLFPLAAETNQQIQQLEQDPELYSRCPYLQEIRRWQAKPDIRRIL